MKENRDFWKENCIFPNLFDKNRALALSSDTQLYINL